MSGRPRLTPEEREAHRRAVRAREMAEYLKIAPVSVRKDEGEDPMWTVQDGDNRLAFNLGSGCRRITRPKVPA
jgi:hypothetical protein